MTTTYRMGCLTGDGAFWRLGSDNGAERYNGAGRWAREANMPLAELSVGAMGNAWGVDTSGNLCQLVASPVVQVQAPAAREVAVTSDDDLWILNWDNNNQPYHRTAPGVWEHVACPSFCWKIAAGDPGDVWLLAESWFYGHPWKHTSTGWVQQGTQLATSIAVGQDGAAWINGDQQSFDAIYRNAPNGEWTQVWSPVNYCVACVQGDEDWVAGDDAYQRIGAGWTLHPAPPGVRFDGVAAGKDGSVICWQGEWSQPGRSFRFNGTGGWEELPLAPPNGFFNAAVGDSHNYYFALWDNHALMRWTGTTWIDAARKVSKVAACADGSVWAIDAGGTAARRTADGTWTGLADRLIHIGAGSADVAWGIDATGAPRKWDGAAFQSFASDLTQALTDISVGSDGAVCAIAADGSLLYLTGASWRQLQPGQAFLRVQVASRDRIAGVTAINLETGTNWVWIGALPASPNARARSRPLFAKTAKPSKPRKRKEPKGKARKWAAQAA